MRAAYILLRWHVLVKLGLPWLLGLSKYLAKISVDTPDRTPGLEKLPSARGAHISHH